MSILNDELKILVNRNEPEPIWKQKLTGNITGNWKLPEDEWLQM